MPLEQHPSKLAPWPPVASNDPQGRVPEAYPVINDPNESFWSIASKTGVAATDLVRYNFLTNKPEEINWYLKNYVGCTKATGDGKNYMFKEATYQPAANKGVIFIPRAAASVKPADPVPTPVPVPVNGVVPIDEKQFNVDPSMLEYNFTRDFPEVAAGWVRYKLSVSGKLKWGPDAGNKVALSISDGKLKDVGGSACFKNFLDHADLNVGFKLKIEDMIAGIAAMPKKKLAQKLGEAVEATLKFKFPVNDHCVLELEPGLTLSTTPFVGKVSSVFFFKTDIAPALGLSQPYVVKVQITFQIGVKIGPGPLFAQTLAAADAELAAIGGLSGASGAAFVAFAFVGFISFGAWYAGNASRKGQLTGLASWYVTGYMYQSGFQATITPTSDPEEIRLIQMGKDDAQRDAEANFPTSSGIRAIQKWMMLWILGAGGEIGTMTGYEAGKKLLNAYVWAKIKKQYGI
jgi:hypothetical protein